MPRKKGQLNLTSGFSIRIVGSLVIASSLPFLINNPLSPIAQVSFAFGNFLLVVGAYLK